MHAHLFIATSLKDTALPEHVRTPSVDVVHVHTSSLGIDDARALTAAALQRPVQSDERSFVLVCQSLTKQAQNALLKLFEDPPRQCRFYLVVPHESLLIPTLRSRFAGAELHDTETSYETAETFLAATYAERIETIAALQKTKDSAAMETLARDVAAVVARTPGSYAVDTLRDAAFVESYIRTKGGSKKMLLEHLALALPVR